MFVNLFNKYEEINTKLSKLATYLNKEGPILKQNLTLLSLGLLVKEKYFIYRRGWVITTRNLRSLNLRS